MSRVKLTDNFLDQYRNVQPNWGYGVVGQVTYLRTYSRPLDQDDPTKGQEAWWQTVRRVVEGVYDAQWKHCDKNGLPWNGNKAQISAQKMYDLIFNFKFLPPGRGLWAMGSPIVNLKGSAALNNCAFISTQDIDKDFSYPFCFLMDMSMLGVGVGGDTRGVGKVTLKEPTVSDDAFVVEDSREGWVESVRVILEAYVGKGKLPAKFDYSQVRPQGTPLKTFGGIASGPDPLKDLHQTLKRMLKSQVGKPIDSTTIVDIFNIIGKCVVAGGIRRSAEIMLGEHTDKDFVQLKDPKHGKKLEDYRWVSNNTLFGEVGMDYSPFVDQIMTNGEPGFMWLDNCRYFRRMADPQGDWDVFVLGENPCGEISLESGEFCNLVEVYPANHDSFEEFKHTLKFAYLFAKSVSLIPTHNKNTNAVIGRNRRIGVSITGIVQAVQKHGARPFFRALDGGYRYLRHLDNIYSKWLCVPESVKLTTVKPSGTISLLPGATPGIHFPHSEYYIRRIKIDPQSPLLPILKEAGYRNEPSAYDDNTTVFEFPVHEPYFVKSKRDVSVWEQMELAAQIQHWWADNSVSVTVTVKPEEAKELPTILSMYETRLKSVSFLPLRDDVYKQAPYEEITREEYEKMIAKVKPLDLTPLEGTTTHEIDEKYCSNDSCELPPVK